MTSTRAYAKINTALVVGPLRPDGKHEVVTILQRIDLYDEIAIEPAGELSVVGYAEDTIVQDALRALCAAALVVPRWRVRVEKRIPVAAGLGGGSADAAAALELANATLAGPLDSSALHEVAASVGADVPYFLTEGTQLATGDGTKLAPVALPSDYDVLVVVPHGVEKESTGAVYAAFDRRDGPRGFRERRASLRDALDSIVSARDLALLPPNDLASSPLAGSLLDAGAFRADVSGAGPAVYGLFERGEDARGAAAALRESGLTVLTRPIASGKMTIPVGRGQAVRQRVLVP